MRHAACALVFLLIASSPVLADSPGGGTSSKATTELRTTGSFTGVSITSVLEVELVVGSASRVELRGPKLWLDRIVTTVKDDVLVVSMPGKYKKIPKLKAVITTPSLATLVISGTAAVVATGVSGTSLDVTISGVGDVDLTGSVDAIHFDLSGAAEVNAKNLATKNATLEISGSGNIAVNASKQVDVSISGVGAVRVFGKPATVNKKVSGTGSIELE